LTRQRRWLNPGAVAARIPVYLSTGTPNELAELDATAGDTLPANLMPSEVVKTTGAQTLSGKELASPKIVNFANAQHDHSSAAQGGSISASGLTGTISSGLLEQPLVVGSSPAEGIKVDLEQPAYPWRDLVGDIAIRGAGGADPTFAVYRGNIRQFQFSVGDEVWLAFHIPHDLAKGTDLYVHAHWSHAAANVTGGQVKWTFECTFAKGFDQQAFPATISASAIQTASATQYRHMVAEAQLSTPNGAADKLDTNALEPDGLILMRAYLNDNSMTVSGGAVPEPFLHSVDLHYQSTNVGTKRKAPDFYASS
jgi:hypothetical protein